MFPIICKIGPVPIYSYGLMLALAILTTSWLVARDANAKLGIPKDDVYDLVLWVVLFGIIGARIFYVGLKFDQFASHPLEMVMLWHGGLAWQGSLLAGFITGVIFLKKKGLPLSKFLDVSAPYIALGHAIGRIGCLLNGCCHGKPASWGIFFPTVGEFGMRLQPTQLYMSVGQIVIFLILRAAQSRSKRDGQVFVWYLMLSSVERFIVEFFRGDNDLYYGLSLFQYISIGIFVAASAANVWLQNNKKSV